VQRHRHAATGCCCYRDVRIEKCCVRIIPQIVTTDPPPQAIAVSDPLSVLECATRFWLWPMSTFNYYLFCYRTRNWARCSAGIPNWGHSELGAQSGRKNQPACFTCVFFQFQLTEISLLRTNSWEGQVLLALLYFKNGIICPPISPLHYHSRLRSNA